MSEQQKQFAPSYNWKVEKFSFSNTHVMAMLYDWLFFCPAFTPEEGKEAKLRLKQVGNKAYGFFSNNDELDVNAPPNIRHDLYELNEHIEKMKLKGTVISPRGSRSGYRVYVYNEKDEKLEYVCKHTKLEDAKSALMLIAIVKE